MSTQDNNDVERLALWFEAAARYLKLSDEVRRVVAFAMNQAVEGYGLPSGDEDDQPDETPALVSRFAAQWDECAREAKRNEDEAPLVDCNQPVDIVIDGHVRDLGRPYKSGAPRLEIHVPKKHAEGLPYKLGERVQTALCVGEVEYFAGLRATHDNDYVWVCPDMLDAVGARRKLGPTLVEAGFVPNEPVRLRISTTGITVEKKG